MTSLITQLHSGLRYLVLALLVYAVINAIIGMVSKRSFSSFDKQTALYTLILTHIQLLTGIVLYVISPKVVFSSQIMSVDVLRFFTLEHPLLMVLSVTLITVGFASHKRAQSNEKFKKIALFYGGALLLILVAIPWNRF